MAEICKKKCPKNPYLVPTRQEMENTPVFLVRTSTGSVVFPPLNIYASFEESCREYNVIGAGGKLSAGVINENLEYILVKRSETHEQDSFQLGQIMFEKHRYKQAYKYFKHAWFNNGDVRAKYQMAVMIFDKLLDPSDMQRYPYDDVTAVDMMKGLLNLDVGVGYDQGNEELVDAAAFNLFSAYLQGWGVTKSNEVALKYLLLAGSTGRSKVSIMAQTVLGYFYSTVDLENLKKAFYWHSEACGNGSVESQAAIGAFYMFGIHVKKDWCAALQCLKESSNRGSIYGRGLLSLLYFQRKLYTNASRLGCDLALDTKLRMELLQQSDNTTFQKRGISIACFIYAVCLDRGLGVRQDQNIAQSMYTRSFDVDPFVCKRMQDMVIREEI